VPSTRTSTRDRPITRDDIEAKLREMAGGVDERVQAARPALLTGAVVGVSVLVVVAYLFGRRRGRRRSAVVEIRRL
jgi:hypothetical protein